MPRSGHSRSSEQLGSSSRAELSAQLAQLRDGLAVLRDRASSQELGRELGRLHRLAQDALATLAQPRAAQGAPAEPLELGDWLRSCSGALVAEALQLRLELQPGLPALSLDPRALEQVLRELFDNAKSSGARELMVNVHTVSLSLAELPPDINPGDYLCIELTDDGQGATPLVAARPQASSAATASSGERSKAYDFARAHGGTLRQQSQRTGGTTVALYLPLARIVAASTGAHRQLPQARRILLVDDEPYARSAARRVLRSMGHEVLEASGGSEACAVAQASGQLDLLLTDLNMPEMDGFELARKLRDQQPALPTLYMCGYPPETIEGAPADAQFIEKPFTYEDLVYKVGQLLDAAS